MKKHSGVGGSLVFDIHLDRPTAGSAELVDPFARVGTKDEAVPKKPKGDSSQTDVECVLHHHVGFALPRDNTYWMMSNFKLNTRTVAAEFMKGNCPFSIFNNDFLIFFAFLH